MTADTTLSVRDLVVVFDAADGPLRAVDGVSFDLGRDEVVAVVGESGSGKSVTMLAVMGLLPRGARIESGTVEFGGRDITHLPPKQRRSILGKDMAMVFQDPMTSLNPVITVGRQLAEMVRQHDRSLSRRAVRARVLDLLETVRLPNAAARCSSYPHEFSGGMRQRVMIAMAVAHNPSLLIADEPTTALDVTIQAQILRVLSRLRAERGSSMALITHDLGLVAEFADRVVVMYGGRVVETGTVGEIFRAPRHPYTAGLLASSLTLDSPADTAFAIPGQPPPLDRRPAGCVFHPRCEVSRGREACTTRRPEPAVEGPGRTVACHFPDDTAQWRVDTAGARLTGTRP